MRYQGGKHRLSKRIVETIESLRKEDQTYYEPFIGSCAVFHKVKGLKFGFDIDQDLIDFWMALQNGWVPPDEISKDKYNEYKSNPDILNDQPYLRGFVAFFCSYGGKKWGGYATDKDNTNYCAISKRASLKILPDIKNTSILQSSYDKIDDIIKPNSIIYCDPPYANTTKYKHEFDSEKFWNKCKEWSNSGHTVLVSEYTAPEFAEELWSSETKTTLTKNTGYGKRIEKLWTIK